MSRKSRISVVISAEDGSSSFSFRLTRWMAIVILSGVILGWIVIIFTMISMVFWRNTEVKRLRNENKNLRTAVSKIDSLKFELNRLSVMRQIIERSLLIEETQGKGMSGEIQKKFPILDEFSPFLKPELAVVSDNSKRLERLEIYIPSGLPVRGPISVYFGQQGTVFRAPHSGLDIYAREGTQVTSTANGLITKVSENNDLGIYVIVDHLNGYTSVYGHLCNTGVLPGKVVKRGDVIGLSGQTGHVRGPHIHYEVRYKNKPIDPLKSMVSF